MRIVGSLTTIPSRINNDNFINVIKSIYNQSHKLEVIYLTIPKFSNLTKRPFTDIPNWINNYCEIIYCDIDHGSLNKIKGALLKEHDPETLIVTFDDDIIYPNNLIEELLFKNNVRPNSCIGSCGFKIGYFPFYGSWVMNQKINRNKWWFQFKVSTLGTKVDILSGYAGVLYYRKFFPYDITELFDLVYKYPNLYNNDDILLSLYVGSQNIDRYVFILPDVNNTLNMKDAISANNLKFVKRFISALSDCKKLKLIKNRQIVPFYNSIMLPFILFFIVVFFIFIYVIHKTIKCKFK